MVDAASILESQILPYLPRAWYGALRGLGGTHHQGLSEIRLRRGRPLVVTIDATQWFLRFDGSVSLTKPGRRGLLVSDECFEETLELITQGSLYALETELKNGFITLPGGHRVGLAGTAILSGGSVRAMKDFCGLNIRIAREITGVADEIMPIVWPQGTTRPLNTLLFSGPGGGKTTLLRDITRQLSEGRPHTGGLAVCIVDERSEIAACYRGVPTHDVGPTTDILDACPKAEGMMMMLRSMGPQVLVTDEIGRPEDALALRDARAGGVTVMATAHASSLDELRARPVLSGLVRDEVFDCLVQLSANPRPGTIKAVHDSQGRVLAQVGGGLLA